MAAAFTRTNQFILGQGVMLITGDLTITSASQTLAPSDLGVKKFIAAFPCTFDDVYVVSPALNSAGSIMSCSIAVADTEHVGINDFPVGSFKRLTFLAV